MIFTEEHVALVQQGRKTQTRRVVKPGEKECRYKPGKAYAAQPGRGKPASLRITIVAVRREKLGAISEKDAKREGYRTVYEFKQTWKELHGTWTPDLDVWVITFVAGDRTEKPRFLAAKLGTRRGDYVDTPAGAARGEGEPLTAWEQQQMSAKAREKPKLTEREVLEEELAKIRASMRVIGDSIDPEQARRQLRLMEQQARKLEQRVLEAAA